VKNALKRLQARLRHRRYLGQARRAIARCDRAVARRMRIGTPMVRRPIAPYFAPGIIDVPERRARAGLRPYLVTLAIAIAAGAFFVLRGGLPS
jgi:hypothetical protein